MFYLHSGRPPLNNYKLVNRTNLSSYTEVFSTRWGRNGQNGSGVNNLAYIENYGSITGKGRSPWNNQPAIYLISGNDFYLKNSGKITSVQDTSEIKASNDLILENGSKDKDSPSMLDKSKFNGKNVFLSNTGYSVFNEVNFRASENFTFSNKGTILSYMTIDDFIKNGKGRYQAPEPDPDTKEKYNKYLEDFYKNHPPKDKDEYFAPEDRGKKYVPYETYKNIIEEYKKYREKIKDEEYKKFLEEYREEYPDDNPPEPGIEIDNEFDIMRLCVPNRECEGTLVDIGHVTFINSNRLYEIRKELHKASLKPKTVDEFIKEGNGAYIKPIPTRRTEEDYSFYKLNREIIGTPIGAKNLYGENSGEIPGTLSLFFQNGYFINSGSIGKLWVNAERGLVVNRGTALLDISDYGEKSGLLEVDLKNSTVSKNSYIDRKQAETRVIVNEETKIDGVLKANGSDETLVVSRDKNSELNDVEAGMDKYDGFEKLEMQGKWAIKEHDATFKQSITFNNAKVELADKTLDSQEVKNSESSAINVTSDAKVNGNFTNEGEVSLTGKLTTSGNVKNSGTIEFNNGLKGTNFVTSGDYTGTGENSLLKMNVDASAGKSKFDLLEVGGNASGTTKIAFMNPKKLEAKMKNRVKLVQTQSSDENAFSLVKYKYGRYKYKFYNVANDGGYSNWYLEQLPTFRKEVAGIVSGFAASQNLFTHTFHDRVAKDKLPEEHTAWVRVYHHNTKYQLNGVDSKADAYSDTLQLGYDALKYNKGTNKFTAGAYVSLGRQKSETYLVEDDERVRSSSKGYSLGIYATWEKPNWYVDSWIQVNRLKTKVNTSDGRSDYKTTALQASLEAGYNKLLNKTDNYAYYVQPQGQVIYNHLHKPDMGEELAVLNPRYFVTRLGLRFYQQSLKHPNYGEPYLALNWWHHTNQTSVVTDEKAISIKGIKDLKNIEVGIDKWHITDNLSVWTNVGYYMGTHNYRDIRYNLGVSYRF
ncbi:autotransporter outer membrane beta-barrel domain-containing protein [Haemophilus haemolyticus]|uniref:autotransporter family protein n=1 Tax=Haemophilus haemolyticus TaxID=726 RepID=UPI000E585902|nr:autotransporter outer membrane beta-barrel domain-containing protein [Haemophilus haemolyticus]